MRLSISNIAWDRTEDDAVAQMLLRHHVDAIDIAPGKYFPDPACAREQDIQQVKAWWGHHGIEIVGMQALLFGTVGLNVFGPTEVQSAMLKHLEAICRIGAGLGAPRLVFGSPRNRDRSGLTDEATMEMAVSFFRRWGDIAKAFGVEICLEPNPTHYGANFMTSSAETAHIVRSVAHPAIRMQLDTGAITMNNEDVFSILNQDADLIGHVHASEPDLLPLGDGGTDHHIVHAALVQYLPHHVVSIEMLATKKESHVESIERALQVAKRHYRLGSGVEFRT